MDSNYLKTILVLCIVFTASQAMSIQTKEEGFISLGSVSNAAGTQEKLFYLSSTEEAWREAWYDCLNSRNGILASIDNAAENEFIHDSLILHGIEKAWTSGFYMGGWMWGANGNLISGGWGPGFPGPTSQAVIVVASGLTAFEWRTEDPNSKQYYICQSV